MWTTPFGFAHITALCSFKIPFWTGPVLSLSLYSISPFQGCNKRWVNGTLEADVEGAQEKQLLLPLSQPPPLPRAQKMACYASALCLPVEDTQVSLTQWGFPCMMPGKLKKENRRVQRLGWHVLNCLLSTSLRIAFRGYSVTLFFLLSQRKKCFLDLNFKKWWVIWGAQFEIPERGLIFRKHMEYSPSENPPF